MNKVRKIFNEIKNEIYFENPTIFERQNFYLHRCKDADKEHQENKRQYMHSLHFPDTICYAKATEKLPAKYIKGLIWHEIGHILSDLKGKKSTEKQANAIIKKIFGITIKYKDCKYGKHLEYIKE